MQARSLQRLVETLVSSISEIRQEGLKLMTAKIAEYFKKEQRSVSLRTPHPATEAAKLTGMISERFATFDEVINEMRAMLPKQEQRKEEAIARVHAELEVALRDTKTEEDLQNDVSQLESSLAKAKIEAETKEKEIKQKEANWEVERRKLMHKIAELEAKKVQTHNQNEETKSDLALTQSSLIDLNEIERIPCEIIRDFQGEPDFRFKLVMIGGLVGKTLLIKRLAKGTFDCQTLATIGIDFVNHTVNLRNKTVVLKIWDTPS
jgi:DNA repair exonuclease SbcCD ATPase subunit